MSPMLLSYSPEGTFVLTLLEMVLSGLALLVLLWIVVRETPEPTPETIRALLAGFVLLVLGFGMGALYCRVALFPPVQAAPSSFWLLFISEEARLLAAGALVTGFLLRCNRPGPARVLGVATLVLAGLVAIPFSSDAALSMRSIVPLTTTRAAEVGVLGIGVALLRCGCGVRPMAALLLIGAGRAVALLAAWQPTATEASWALEHLATLGGLIWLALTVERESRQTSLRFFLRLNLIFLSLASSLILVVTEIERRQFVAASALNVQDLGEFVRGHMLYYTNRGEPPEQALAHDDIVQRLVSEFGRYPSLRRVQASLQGHAMALSINDQGELDLQYWVGDRERSPKVNSADFEVDSLLELPISSRGELLGQVQLDHSLATINRQIGWQMQIIFVVFTLFVGAASVVTGILVIASERTIRRQYAELEGTQRRLWVAERLASIGSVVDGVAHEINNPAGILVARSDYLLSVTEGRLHYADVRDDLDTIRRQAQRIAKTVKDLLTFTRPARQSRDMVDVHGVLESAIMLVRPLALEHALTIDRCFAAQAPPVIGDRHRLEQVFLNLLTNAVHACGPGGRITLTTAARPEDAGLEVLVRDTGTGIRPEHLNRIFDPFFTTKAPGSGTGLGLSIAYGIIRDHGGTIDATSTTNVGTEFRVTLPLADGWSADRSDPAVSSLARSRGERTLPENHTRYDSYQ